MTEFFNRYWRNLPAGLRLVLVYWLFTRIVFTILGTASIFLIGHYSDAVHHVIFPQTPRYSGLPFIDMWSQWDSSWYQHIAKYGYQGIADAHKETDIVFFPLYPYIIRLLSWPFHFANTAVIINGLLVSNICFIVGAYYLYKFAAQRFGERIAKLTTLALFLSPMGFIFSAVMSEGLFFLLLVLAFSWAEAGRWTRVGLASALMVLTRPVGLIVSAVLALMYWLRLKFSWRRLFQLQNLWLLGPFVGLIIFMIINQHIVHDRLGFLHAAGSGWHRHIFYLRGPSGGLLTLQGLYLVAYPLAALALMIWAVVTRRLRWVYALLALAMVVVPGLTGLYGLIRYTSLIFPIYIGLAFLIDRLKAWYEPAIMTLLIIESVHLVWWTLGMPIMQ